MSTARSLNKVMLIGNLTRPPVLRKTTNGAVVGTFGLATNATWKDADGNIQERAEFHNIVAWNKLAEICAQILNTGMLIYVEGELRTRTWEGDDKGKKFYRTEIKINDMKLLDSKTKKGFGIDEALTAGEESDIPVGSVATFVSPVADDSTLDDVTDIDEESKSDAEELF